MIHNIIVETEEFDFIEYDDESLAEELLSLGFSSSLDQRDFFDEGPLSMRFISNSPVSSLSEFFIEWYMSGDYDNVSDFLQSENISHLLTTDNFNDLINGRAYLDMDLAELLRQMAPIRVQRKKIQILNNKCNDIRYVMISAPDTIYDELHKLSVAKRKSQNDSRVNYYAKLSPEQRKEYNTKSVAAFKRRIASLTPEQRKEFWKKRREYYKQWHTALSPELREKYKKQRREYFKEWFSKLSPEQREKYKEQQRKCSKGYYSNLSPEKREKYKEQQRKRRKERYSNLSPEKREEYKEQQKRYKEQRKEIQKNQPAASRHRYAELSPEQKSEHTGKIIKQTNIRFENMPTSELAQYALKEAEELNRLIKETWQKMRQY